MMQRLIRQFTAEGYPFLLSLLCVTAMPLFPEYGAPCLAIAGLFFAYLDARSRGKGICIGTLGRLLLLYIAFMAVGILYSDHRGNSFATLLMWVTMFCDYLILTTILYNRQRLRIALYTLAIATGIVGLIACVEYLLRDIMGFSSLPNQLWYKFDRFFYRHFPMNVDLTMGDNRAASTFNNPNILAEYLVMTIPLVGYVGFNGRRTPARLTARVFMLTAIFGAIVSFSRGAYIALLSMLLLIIFTHMRKITPFMMCLIAAVSLIPEAVISRFLTIGTGDGSIFERFAAWEVAVQAIIQHPLFGMGPGISNFWEYLVRMGVDIPHAHNLILQILVEGGFVALFLMCLVATRLLQDSLSLIQRSESGTAIGITFLIFAVAFVVHGMVDYPFLSPKLVGTFCLVLGFFDTLAAQYLPNRITSVRDFVLSCVRKIKTRIPIPGRKRN